ncbi:rebM [Symbiodinium microadriaticum]|nr:rebM [Symbiodinium microadriaticum]
MIDIQDGDRVLDLGCGPGRHLHAAFTKADCHVVGVDLGFDDLKQARDAFWDAYGTPPAEHQRWSVSVGNALTLPFPDGSFDKIICSEVLEHIPDYQGALDEINRILKPGGVFACSVPRYGPEWVCWALSQDYQQEPGGHVRIFRDTELQADIEKRGYSFFGKHWAHALHSPYWWLRCAVYDNQESSKLVAAYKKFLEWDLLEAPWVTRKLEEALNPVMGKSVAMYFRKDAAAAEITEDLKQAHHFSPTTFDPVVEFISDVQMTNGAIPWEAGEKLDVWDHTEAAMGLAIGGEIERATRAYLWLKNNQLLDGSWWAEYKYGQPSDRTRKETNFCAYVATGVWHQYLVTGDEGFLVEMWPTVEAAIDFVLRLQTPEGDIVWAAEPNGTPGKDSLLTACASIYKSLECAWAIADKLGKGRDDWLIARARLGRALRQKPERFDRTWDDKSRYSMDWFYPILTGVMAGDTARARIAARWDEFIVDGMGCRCVADEPWVTVAESCELVMALVATGQRGRAAELYSWLHQWRSDNGAYWTGYQFKLDLLWPDEKPTWTAGAVLLAADALFHHTPAYQLLTHPIIDVDLEAQILIDEGDEAELEEA